MAKRPIPQINVPIMTANGSMELAWYLFFQWIAENSGNVDLSDYFTKEETEALLELKANTADLAPVATSGSYDDLTGKPTLGTAAAANVTDFATAAQGALAATAVQPGDDISVLNNNAEYITASYHDATKQDLLVSGTNIKTVNGNSLLGSGDITISSSATWGGIQGTLDDQADLKNALDLKANTDMGNLTDTGKNTANWSSNVSNYITEIPQDINLTLSDGILTLQAGSVVYKPNGVGVFQKITTIESTFSDTDTTTYQAMVFYKSSRTLDLFPLDECTTRTSTPPPGSGSVFCYNLSTNKIDWYMNGIVLPNSNYSFPVAIVTMSGASGVTSIDQIFNGFGFIGSTLFVLPGVKGLIPNGRNANGTLKSTGFSVSQVLIQSDLGSYTSSRCFTTNGTVITSPDGLSYNAETNYNTTSNGNWDGMSLATFDLTVSGSTKTITNFKPRRVFRALGYNDSEYIAHCAMPSNTRVDLTLGTSGSAYTAPADGWIFLNKTVGTANTKIEMWNTTTDFRTITATGGLTTATWAYCSIYVNKGDSVQVTYSVTGTTNAFCFIYANGANKNLKF